MPNRVQWNPRHSVGNETLDHQHEHILARCNALADCLDDGGDDSDRKFGEIFDEMMLLARAHFAAEEALLAACGYPELEDHRSEQEEFDFLADEIITTENFDKSELQAFLALWWTGHIVGSASKYRPVLEKQPAA